MWTKVSVPQSEESTGAAETSIIIRKVPANYCLSLLIVSLFRLPAACFAGEWELNLQHKLEVTFCAGSVIHQKKLPSKAF